MHLRPFVRSWACWCENEVCSGALLARCYFEATEINCATDQLKPGLKSKAVFHLEGCVLRRSNPLEVPPAMASWAPCTVMASWAPSSAMASFVCLFHSGGPRPVFLSMSVLRGLQSAHPPPRWSGYSVGHAFREGGVMSGFCCVCHVFLPLVSIFGLFPVLVKCDY